MTWDKQDLAHVLHYTAAVHFVLPRPLHRDAFLWALHALESRAGRSLTAVTAEEHWQAVEERMAGRSRWDAVVPRYRGPLKTGDDFKRQAATTQSVENILRHRRFTAYAIDDIRYTVDLFNPSNELAMPYAGAAEPVIVLLFHGMEPPSTSYPAIVRDRLFENKSFYEILKDLDGILHPEQVCGTYSMMSVLWAYLEGRVDPSYRPWEFLFPLHVLKDAPIPLTPETRISGRLVGMLPGKEVKLAKVEDWGGGRVLIQVNPGLEANISWEYFAVAKALGMTPVQELVEGSAPPREGARP